MKVTRRLCWMLVIGLAIALPTACQAKDSLSWGDNFKKAEAEAKSSSKPILCLFTGSNWCPACQKLEREVIDSPEFAKEFGGDAVFVRIERERSGYKNDEDRTLGAKYGISGFPTIVVFNSKGDAVGRKRGYGRGTQERTMKEIQDLLDKAKNQTD